MQVSIRSPSSMTEHGAPEVSFLSQVRISAMDEHFTVVVKEASCRCRAIEATVLPIVVTQVGTRTYYVSLDGDHEVDGEHEIDGDHEVHEVDELMIVCALARAANLWQEKHSNIARVELSLLNNLEGPLCLQMIVGM